ncbi:phage portal protein [Brachybacterium rhamnosum]|uniref:Phage portal protein n=1 Tax=Brachybacterium rhamnosum TaxID=173361 RepID=A0ABW4Q1N1_9MICO
MLTPDPGVPLSSWTDAADMTVDRLFSVHPSVRKVTSFIAAQIASLPWNVYERGADDDRQRVREGALADLLAWPSVDPLETPFRFWESVLLDGLIFDRVALQLVTDDQGRPRLLRLPAHTWRPKLDRLHRLRAVTLIDGDGSTVDHDPQEFLVDVGYSPRTSGRSASPLESLAVPIEEWLKQAAYRAELFERGPAFGGVVERSEKWPNGTARDRFLTGLRSFKQGGTRAGSMLLLEDGMTYKPVTGINPKDVADVEARKLTDVEVAAAFHIAPEMVGAREGTFANLNAFRTMLWSVNLGPYITGHEQMIGRLVAMVEPGKGRYIEANVQAKMRGSFEEQASQLQTSIGAPWMTRNEGRARMNLPAVDGGDELITPLNVLEGGQASPTDSAPPPKAGLVRRIPDDVMAELHALGRAREDILVPSQKTDDSGGDDRDRDEVAALLRRHFDRQKLAVSPLLAGGADEWWDADRWNNELAADLYDAAIALSSTVGAVVATRLRPDARYSVARTLAYLEAVVASRAEWINDTTRAQLATAKAEGADPAGVFDTAAKARSVAAAGAFVAGVGSFAAHEAGRQNLGSKARKTWVTRSNDPRDTHAAMNGVTVGIDAVFPNGMKWPGDSAGGADEVAGCQCGLVITPEN